MAAAASGHAEEASSIFRFKHAKTPFYFGHNSLRKEQNHPSDLACGFHFSQRGTNEILAPWPRFFATSENRGVARIKQEAARREWSLLV